MVGMILTILALVLFALAALNTPSSRVNLLAAGLFFLTLAYLLAGWPYK